MLHKKERWLRQGLQLKVSKLPVKVLNRSAKPNKRKVHGVDEDDVNDYPGPGGTIYRSFWMWQTEPLCLPPAGNEIVPNAWSMQKKLGGEPRTEERMKHKKFRGAIDDPRPGVGSLNMSDVRRLSTHVAKLRDIPEGVLVLSGLSRVWKSYFYDLVLRGADGNVIGIHDFLCLPKWTGAEVQKEPHLDARST
nr:DNA repair protein RAD4 [Tanacetum cinerariifolium]